MINGELIVDNFAGGGGASTGIEEATGFSVDIAINHDPKAIAMHKANHPNTKHYEIVLKMLNNTIDSYYNELRDLKHREDQERKKQERWEIAQAQGCSYAEWLEQEEVSRQSEEYEKIMGGNNNV